MSAQTEDTAPVNSLEASARLVEALKLDLVGPGAHRQADLPREGSAFQPLRSSSTMMGCRP
jgi:hypothetical protein